MLPGDVHGTGRGIAAADRAELLRRVSSGLRISPTVRIEWRGGSQYDHRHDR